MKDRPSRQPRSVLILRPDNLGDLVLFSGELRHMRALWPSAQITLCARSHGRQFFAHCPYIDKFLSYESLQWTGRLYWPQSISWGPSLGRWLLDTLQRVIPSIGYDLTVLPIVSPWITYHRIMAFLPSRERVGVCGSRDNANTDEVLRSQNIYSRHFDAAQFPPAFSELERNRLFLRFLGADVKETDFWPEFWTQDSDRAAAKELLQREPGKLLIGIAPGVSWPLGKQLPASWYVETLRDMRRPDMQFVLLGAGSDQAICGEIERALSEASITNLAGKTSILEMIECIRACDVMLCADAAPLHISTALRKPVVGLLGGGHFGRFYPWGDPKLARVVNKPMDCYGCNWECKFDRVRCIQEIAPADAIRELTALIDHVLGSDRSPTECVSYENR